MIKTTKILLVLAIGLFLGFFLLFVTPNRNQILADFHWCGDACPGGVCDIGPDGVYDQNCRGCSEGCTCRSCDEDAACCGGGGCDVNDWGGCSASCGPGTQTNACGDTRGCNNGACCDPNAWGGWSACSTSCGPGTQSRTNACGTTETQSCQINDPNVWSGWGTCTVNCGTGTQSRTNQCGTPQTQDCNTQVCPAWIKLKDLSFISPNSLTDMIALLPAPYDADDTTDQYFIVGKVGVVAAPAININISNSSPTAKTGDPEYKAVYTPSSYSMTPNSYLSYVKARKDYKAITGLNEITGSGTYIYGGDITINSNVAPFNQAYNIVLITDGAITVAPAPDNTFTPAGSVAIVAPTINFNSNIVEAQGIFIANEVSTGTNATQGLKVIGNLIAQTSLSNNREWPTTSKPSLFIKFDQTKYIDLVPYLSTANYQWNQIQ